MKIRVGIVSYNNATDLNNLLASLFASDIIEHDYSIEVINNHSNFNLRDEFKDRVNVIHNRVRPDWSTGHISKDYNSILVRGFGNLNAPHHDIVIIIQEDNVVKPDFISKLIPLHQTYSYIAAGVGGQLMSFLPDAIKKIGLFDERISSVGSHDTDYFIRSVIWNRERTSLNDIGQGRVLNPSTNDVNYGFHTPIRSDGDLIRCVNLSGEHIESLKPIWAQPPLHMTALQWIWGQDIKIIHWTDDDINHIEQNVRPMHKCIMMYPYFESAVENPLHKYEFC